MSRISLVGLRVTASLPNPHGAGTDVTGIVEATTEAGYHTIRLDDGTDVGTQRVTVLDMDEYRARLNPPADNPDRTAHITGKAIGTAIVDRFFGLLFTGVPMPTQLARWVAECITAHGAAMRR